MHLSSTGSDGEQPAGRVRPPLLPITDAEHKALGLPSGVHPPSANQEQMVVLYSLDKQSSVYNMPTQLTTAAGTVLDEHVLRRCLDAGAAARISAESPCEDAVTKQTMQRVCPSSEIEVSLEVMDDCEEVMLQQQMMAMA